MGLDCQSESCSMQNPVAYIGIGAGTSWQKFMLCWRMRDSGTQKDAIHDSLRELVIFAQHIIWVIWLFSVWMSVSAGWFWGTLDLWESAWVWPVVPSGCLFLEHRMWSAWISRGVCQSLCLHFMDQQRHFSGRNIKCVLGTAHICKLIASMCSHSVHFPGWEFFFHFVKLGCDSNITQERLVHLD